MTQVGQFELMEVPVFGFDRGLLAHIVMESASKAAARSHELGPARLSEIATEAATADQIAFGCTLILFVSPLCGGCGCPAHELIMEGVGADSVRHFAYEFDNVINKAINELGRKSLESFTAWVAHSTPEKRFGVLKLT